MQESVVQPQPPLIYIRDQQFIHSWRRFSIKNVFFIIIFFKRIGLFCFSRHSFANGWSLAWPSLSPNAQKIIGSPSQSIRGTDRSRNLFITQQMAERRYLLTDIYREQTKGQARGMFLLTRVLRCEGGFFKRWLCIMYDEEERAGS